MTNDEVFAATTVQRNRLLDTTETFTENDWNTPSLCDGWRVRDVLGHPLWVLEVPFFKQVVGACRTRSWDGNTAREAVARGSLEPADLIGRYRRLAAKRYAPPIIGAVGELSDICTHTRDIERALARSNTLDAASVRAVLDFAFTRAGRTIAGSRAKGLSFQASDLDWHSGDGPLVQGSGEAIMMALHGRKAALADLAGDGVGLLTDRMG